MKWTESTIGDGRAEQRQHLHHAREGVDDEGAAEGRLLASAAAADDQHRREAERPGSRR